MVDRCDPNRLRMLLDDRLGEAEQGELARHLEACDGCRRGLERLAAESRLWGDARRLADEVEATAGPEPADGSDPGLGFLDPPGAAGGLGSIGAYEVVEVIGRGGMGVVLKAFDPTLGRHVAIKVLAPELATSATARRRFAREARAAAALSHDHIVAIHAVDVTPGGLPFLVMPYVAGRSLQDRLDRTGPLEVREVLRIGMQAAAGLAAAHEVGLVHRDIKPANILLENCVERVKLTDFGLARAADDASLTQSGVVAGTPQYMAPEQARGEPVDARSDLFSLGSVLYALCTGRPPFRAESTMGVLRRVCDDTPRPVREVNPEVPDWLQAIVAKLQAKDPAERFASAAEVSALFGRCLAYLEAPGKRPPPFQAERPPAPRRKAPAWAVAALALLVTAAGLGASEASGVSKLADLVATVLRIKTADGTLVLVADDPEVKVRVDGEDVVIEGAGPKEIRLGAGRHQVEKVKGGVVFDRDVVTITRGGKQTFKATFEPNPPPTPAGPTAATAGTLRELIAQLDRQVVEKMDRAAIQALKARISELEGQLRLEKRKQADDLDQRLSVARQRLDQARRLARNGDDPSVRSALRTYESLVGKMEAERQGAGPTPAGSFARPEVTRRQGMEDGYLLMMARNSGGRMTGPGAPRLREVAHLMGQRLWSLAYSPDGRTLAVTGGVRRTDPAGPGWSDDRGALTLWHLDRRVLGDTLNGPRYVRSAAFSPDGKTLATAEIDGTAKLRDPADGRVTRVLRGHTEGVNAVAFTPDGTLLATAGLDGAVKLWEVAGGREVWTLQAHDGPAHSVAVRPDGRVLASCGADHTVRLWGVPSGGPRVVLRGHKGAVETVAFAPDGKTLASAGWDHDVRLWDGDTGASRAVLAGHREAVLGLAFSPDGRRLATCGGSWGDDQRDHPGRGELKLWDLARPSEPSTLDGHTDRVLGVAFSPDGKTLASAGWDGVVRLWQLGGNPAAPGFTR